MGGLARQGRRVGTPNSCGHSKQALNLIGDLLEATIFHALIFAFLLAQQFILLRDITGKRWVNLLPTQEVFES